MIKHFVNWKTVTLKDIGGDNFEAEVPVLIEHCYRGRLISKILNMPKKKPVQFADAIRTAWYHHVHTDKIGHDRGESHWFLSHFVEWISELGYHIELTGDEFDLYVSDESRVN